MNKKINSALISVFYKDGLEPLAKQLQTLGVTIYSTGGTQKFLEDLGLQVVPVEELTSYPSILGGRVKTLHPSVFGGILGRRDNEQDVREMKQYEIPVIDLVIVDLYPFQETVAQTSDEKLIIEKIDIGGPSIIRAAAKNFSDVTVIAAKQDYDLLLGYLRSQEGSVTLQQRREFAAKAFSVVAQYDNAIDNYFHDDQEPLPRPELQTPLRYGENPHQKAFFSGILGECFDQLHGKEISYNNLVDIDAAIQLVKEFDEEGQHSLPLMTSVFAIIKHTNVCGIAARSEVLQSWKDALAGDPESAFGGVLICNREIDAVTAEAINEIFFEVLIAPGYSGEALEKLRSKKNRILLQLMDQHPAERKGYGYGSTSNAKSILNGMLQQDEDAGNYAKWEEVGGRNTTDAERQDLEFANLVAKHLKSNAIALVKNTQLIGKGCGQTSRIDALRHAVEKARQFKFSLDGAVMASDAFFPFDDCVKMGHEAGITAYIQPGGSIRDKDSIEYCKENNLAMVMTGMRHFRH